MIRRRICYLLLLAAGGYFIMLYNFQGLRFLFCCVICIPLLSLLFLIPVKFSCGIRLQVKQRTMNRGELPEALVTVENRGFLPVPAVLLELRWREPGEREVRSRKWVHGLRGNAGETYAPELTAMHCGFASLELAKACAFDYLGIFSLQAGKRQKVGICVLPVISPVPSGEAEACSLILRGLGEEREGDLLLRDFLPGDNLHRVYWKMLAKGGELQVRDFERSNAVTLFLRFSDTLKKDAQGWDRYLDRAVSLLYFLAEECRTALQVSAEAVWRQGDGFCRQRIPDGEAVQFWVCGLLQEDTTGRGLSQEDIASLERGWHLEEDGRLYFGEQCIYEE